MLCSCFVGRGNFEQERFVEWTGEKFHGTGVLDRSRPDWVSMRGRLVDTPGWPNVRPIKILRYVKHLRDGGSGWRCPWWVSTSPQLNAEIDEALT